MGKAAPSIRGSLQHVLGPIAILHIQGRKMGGRLAKHGSELSDLPSFDRPKGPLLWFHAVSVGEGMDALPVIKKCLKTRPYVNILMTTSTVTYRLKQAEKVEIKKEEVDMYVHIPIFCLEKKDDLWKELTATITKKIRWPETSQLSFCIDSLGRTWHAPASSHSIMFARSAEGCKIFFRSVFAPDLDFTPQIKGT